MDTGVATYEEANDLAMLDLALYFFIMSKFITEYECECSSLGFSCPPRFSTQLFYSLPYACRFPYFYFPILDSLLAIATKGISTSAILKFIALINVDFILGLVGYELCYAAAYLRASGRIPYNEAAEVSWLSQRRWCSIGCYMLGAP